MIKFMEKEFLNGQTGRPTKASGRTTKEMARANQSNKTAIPMTGIMLMTCETAKALNYMQMEIGTTERGLKIKGRDRAFCYMPMAINI